MTFKGYVARVLSHIECDSRTRKRLKEDILMDLLNRSDMDRSADPVELMGHPKDLAMEIIDEQELKSSPGFEYISDKTLFGLPLVHIVTKRRGVAKGVFAFGLVSVGIFSFGIMSLGLLSLGVVSLGLLLSIGSVSISGLLSLGAISISAYFALGAVSIGQLAIGALAYGKLALGDVAFGDIALYKTEGTGNIALSIVDELREVKLVLDSLDYPKPILDMFKNLSDIM